MSCAKKEKKVSLFSQLAARLLGIGHLPAPGQTCSRCGQKGHLTCWYVDGPDIEHIAVELHNIEKRAA